MTQPQHTNTATNADTTTTRMLSKLARFARPFIRAGRHIALTAGLLMASFVLYIITTGVVHALTGDSVSGLVVPWGIATVIAYRICRHHVF